MTRTDTNEYRKGGTPGTCIRLLVNVLGLQNAIGYEQPWTGRRPLVVYAVESGGLAADQRKNERVMGRES